MSEYPAYQNTELPFETRVDDLISRLTLEEKVSQMLHRSPAIERLNIPAYNWWNECLHGIGRAGLATVFPQAIGMAATWNPDLIFEVATVISDEGRAKHHQALREGNHGQYYGLTFWTPNINIFRDPRWGRGQETYGECPHLTARLGVAFIKGIQGDDPKYLKAVATPKHYAVHSGPEHDRHHFDVDVSERDLRLTYLPQFKAAVVEGQAYSVMSAYQRFRGEACSSHHYLLEEILRQEWGFEGYIVSDCGAIYDIFAHHGVVATAEEAAARAVQAGCDLNCGQVYEWLVAAVEQGLITEATIDISLKRLFLARFKLGMFDPPEIVPYAHIPYEVSDSPAHRALARRTAQEALVLLKNADNLLPLDKSELKTIAVIGPNANSVSVLQGNYNGLAAQPITPYMGILQAAGPDVDVIYAKGCNVTGLASDELGRPFESNENITAALDAARRADVAVVVMGLSQALEGEEGQREGVEDGPSQGDRRNLGLPEVQQRLLEAIAATGTPVVLVLLNGSPVSVGWAHEHIPAIIEAWYPGQAGGTALADALFGDYNPAGRLPITVYRSMNDLPPFEDYAMQAAPQGRTYRYFTGQPLYAFGYGLSYTRFAYRDLELPATVNAGAALTVGVTVENTGDYAGDEVVQVYLTDNAASVPVPVRQLVGFVRLTLEPGEAQRVEFSITPEHMSVFTDEGTLIVEPGTFTVAMGGQQPGAGGGVEAHTTGVVTGTFTVVGEPVPVV